MENTGRISDPQQGRILMQALDASALEQQQALYRNALPVFVEQGLLTQAEADAIIPLIGLPNEDVMHLLTPYDRALNAGIITQKQLVPMRQEITRQIHSPTAKCSGTAAHIYSEIGRAHV